MQPNFYHFQGNNKQKAKKAAVQKYAQVSCTACVSENVNIDEVYQF